MVTVVSAAWLLLHVHQIFCCNSAYKPAVLTISHECLYSIFSAQNGQEAEDKERFNGDYWAAGGVCCGKNTRSTSRKWESRILLEVERIYRVSCMGHPLIRKCFPGMGLCYAFINGCMKGKQYYYYFVVMIVTLEVQNADLPAIHSVLTTHGSQKRTWIVQTLFQPF